MTSATITLPVVDDNLVEGTESVIAMLTGVDNGFLLAASAANLTATQNILDNDTAHITISDVTQAEGTGAGTTAFTFTVSIDRPVAQNVTVTANTADGTATQPTDNAAVTNQTVTFTAGGALTQTVTVNVNQDDTVENDETFFVNLTNAQFGGATDATRATITDSQGQGTITNDDSETLTITSPTRDGRDRRDDDDDLYGHFTPAVQGGFEVAFSAAKGTADGSDYSVTTASPLTLPARPMRRRRSR